VNLFPWHYMYACAPLLLQAIYSIFKTETEMVEDLKMVINVGAIHACSCMRMGLMD